LESVVALNAIGERENPIRPGVMESRWSPVPNIS
jgi:hypothetical protein